ncbi:NUDIX domain-containing protein [Candidatus Woesearchaeota archaeon]|nr:NUDIX domain-containing protein [Candidatus Woesearchaeota archaeon]
MTEEMVDVVDENDNVIDTVTRKEMRQKNLKHRSTFILVFNSKGEILVTKRTDTKDVYPGLYEVCHGGTVEHVETFDDNAKKEMEEELGIKNPKLESLFTFSYKDEVQNCIGKAYKCIYDGELVLQEEEVVSFEWISIDEVKKKIEENSEKFCTDDVYALRRYLKK